MGLGGNNLSGPIPPELGALVHLKELDLRLNQLSGPIPSELGDLVHLEFMSLGWNKPERRHPA